MPKNFSLLNKIVVYTGAITTIAIVASIQPAQSQLLPQIWGTIGAKDGDISYGAGARLVGFGVEVGTGKDGATGVDVLKFIDLPIISPYIGAGWYSGDDSFAYSGGIQLRPDGNFFVGAGYHSIRGVNGQIGFKF